MYYDTGFTNTNQRDVEGQWTQILNDVTETNCRRLPRSRSSKMCPLPRSQVLIHYCKGYSHSAVPLTATAASRKITDLPMLPTRNQARLGNNRSGKSKQQAHRQRLHESKRPVLLRESGGRGSKMFTKGNSSSRIEAVVTKESTPYEYKLWALTMRQNWRLKPRRNYRKWLDETQGSRTPEIA